MEIATFWIAFVLCVIIGAVIGACNSWDDCFEDGLWGGMLGAYVGLFVGFFSVCAVSGFMADAELSHNMVESQKIVALKDNGNVTGSFFLGSGIIKDEMYYYYVAAEGKGIKMNRVAAESCYVQYTDSDFRIETYSVEFADSWRNHWAIPIQDDYHLVYIPIGSITTDFSIDLE